MLCHIAFAFQDVARGGVQRDLRAWSGGLPGRTAARTPFTPTFTYRHYRYHACSSRRAAYSLYGLDQDGFAALMVVVTTGRRQATAFLWRYFDIIL